MVCVSCARFMPCGCGTPEAANGQVAGLFGLVCPSCDAYNDPSRRDCAECGSLLEERLVSASDIDSLAAGAPVKPAAAAELAPIEAPAENLPLPELIPVPVPVPEPEPEPTALVGLEAAAPQLELIEDGDILALEGNSTPQPAPFEPAEPVAQIGDDDILATEGNATPQPLSDDLLPWASGPEAPAPAAPTSAAAIPFIAAISSPVATVARRPGTAPPRGKLPSPDVSQPFASADLSLEPFEQLEPMVEEPPAKPTALPGLAARVLRGERAGESLPLGPQATVGRGPCELSFPGDPYLAAAHCKLASEKGRLIVRDSGGSSGTFVSIHHEFELAPGDLFALGDRLFRFLGTISNPTIAEDGTLLDGGPRPPRDVVRLEEIHEGLVPGRALLRRGPSVVFGRDEGCDVAFPGDRSVSGQHCSLTLHAGRAGLKDLGSTNGTFRRLLPGEAYELSKGDSIRAGGEVLQFVES
jgi:pSer/pThr/pTyr-binding forkhead associated (FHA) protein